MNNAESEMLLIAVLANDTSILERTTDSFLLLDKITKDLERLKNRASYWCVEFNTTKYQLFSKKPDWPICGSLYRQGEET